MFSNNLESYNGGKKSKRRSNRRRGSRRKISRPIRGSRAPPNGVITKAWVKRVCPCRDGDNCIPCPSDLRKYVDGRKGRNNRNKRSPARKSRVRKNKVSCAKKRNSRSCRKSKRRK